MTDINTLFPSKYSPLNSVQTGRGSVQSQVCLQTFSLTSLKSFPIRGRFKIKNTIICGKSQGQNQKSLHFKCRLSLTEWGGLIFSDFSQIQITEI